MWGTHLRPVSAGGVAAVALAAVAFEVREPLSGLFALHQTGDGPSWRSAIRFHPAYALFSTTEASYELLSPHSGWQIFLCHIGLQTAGVASALSCASGAAGCVWLSKSLRKLVEVQSAVQAETVAGGGKKKTRNAEEKLSLEVQVEGSDPKWWEWVPPLGAGDAKTWAVVRELALVLQASECFLALDEDTAASLQALSPLELAVALFLHAKSHTTHSHENAVSVSSSGDVATKGKGKEGQRKRDPIEGGLQTVPLCEDRDLRLLSECIPLAQSAYRSESPFTSVSRGVEGTQENETTVTVDRNDKEAPSIPLRGFEELVWEPSSSWGEHRPAHFLAVNRSEKKAVFSVRGTRDIEDVLTDLAVVPETLREKEMIEGGSDDGSCCSRGEEKGTGGARVTHRGFGRAAELLFTKYEPLFALLKESGYEITIVGHSLGAGTAAILCWLLHCRLDLPPSALKCFAFSPPPSVSAAISRDMRPFVTSMVLQDDIVPRMKAQNLAGLLRSLLEREWKPGDLERELAELLSLPSGVDAEADRKESAAADDESALSSSSSSSSSASQVLGLDSFLEGHAERLRAALLQTVRSHIEEACARQAERNAQQLEKKRQSGKKEKEERADTPEELFLPGRVIFIRRKEEEEEEEGEEAGRAQSRRSIQKAEGSDSESAVSPPDPLLPTSLLSLKRRSVDMWGRFSVEKENFREKVEEARERMQRGKDEQREKVQAGETKTGDFPDFLRERVRSLLAEASQAVSKSDSSLFTFGGGNGEGANGSSSREPAPASSEKHSSGRGEGRYEACEIDPVTAPVLHRIPLSPFLISDHFLWKQIQVLEEISSGNQS
uniref:sn-1-specific diacylglycerol lipase n=1 Tax=Chromera velia CCMP2878 TaxID=1169474 RepID=A0A0G4HBU8_9ALVE|eukprot:Cvel_928.t1-p1 / transcript=Cvel_928.t1 / gene=Cvel_928 / organism=Chromera_velia_CCMP2878 / gene_product=Sn1-specific diacylglycerol lipase alpha, putative / transcript_product=Sn1-specific diacylglycerol lipase alpha, putative / location=Cvel_scaffold29:121624-126258(+) / protein_length=835 / sequence_SO=supercontig / SO=protein_coding / is_pseudo=false